MATAISISSSAKGRHWPLIDRVRLHDGKGAFVTTDLAPTADRSYSAVLTDVDGNGSRDLVLSNDRPDHKLVYLNDGKARFRNTGTCGAPEWTTRNAAVADLNGDGRPDIIAANRGGASHVCPERRHRALRRELTEARSQTQSRPGPLLKACQRGS